MVLGLTSNIGPLIGPVIAGFSSVRDWRWMLWISLIMNAIIWPMLLLLPETFPPVILRRAKVNEKATMAAHHQATANDWNTIVQVILTRPIRMFAEPIVLLTDLFLLYQYSVLFLYFEAYPIIFKGVYGMHPGGSACMLLPIGIGAIAAVFIFLLWDRFYQQSKLKGKAWAQKTEYRRLPLACLGGPLYAISEFWLGWTARPNIHWIVPALSGIPFGIGIDLTFMALNTYVADTYDIHSSSALASSVLSRNVAAALLLPLATYPMYDHLGIQWACSLMGFICVVSSAIPFFFLRYGSALRAKSPFCRRLEKNGPNVEEMAEDI